MLTETQKRAIKIRRAEIKAQRRMTRLDESALRELSGVYQQASLDLREMILNAADPNGSLVVEVLRPLLSQIERLMKGVGRQRDDLLDSSIRQAVGIGSQIMQAESASISIGITQAADDALKFMISHQAADGLQLSDRLWRLDRGATAHISRVINQAVIQGMGVSEATDALLSANAAEISKQASGAMTTGQGNPRANAMRVMRTEINRAHGEAYRNSFFAHPDAVGMKFNLSSNHPRKDICDMHATVNRYGLGKGVYPKGRSPWPAHPNTLSFETGVFKWDVSEEDRAGKEDRISWLKKQSRVTQDAVLGQGKAGYLRSGDLSERMITSRLSAVINRVERKEKVN